MKILQLINFNRTNLGLYNDSNMNYHKYIMNNKKIENKNSIKLQQNNIIQHKNNIPNSKNKISKTNSKRQFTLSEYQSVRNVRKQNKKYSKERFQTEQEKEKAVYIKIKHKNKSNLINSIPNSIKKIKTTRQNNSRIYKENHIKLTSGNFSYLKLDESKVLNKHRHITKKNSISKLRSKTPSLYDNNIYTLPQEILTSNICNEYNKNNLKRNNEYKRSITYIKDNLKTAHSTKDCNLIYHYNNNKNSKLNINKISSENKLKISNKINYMVNKGIIKKIKQNKKNILINKERPSSVILSKRVFDYNNVNNNKNLSLNYNNERKNNSLKRHLITKSEILHTCDSNYNVNINSNYKIFKSYRLNNKSAGNINYSNDLLNDNYSPIRKENKCKINKYNKNYEQNHTSVESDNISNYNYSSILQKKARLINNNINIPKNNHNYYQDQNIKKINNTKNYQHKRLSNDKNKERNRKNLIPNRDLTETELINLLNSDNIKENYRNNRKKSLNLSLNENIAPNNFLKHIRKSQYLNTNNVKLNKFYINSNNNNIKIIERNKGTHIYNNFYSINNIGGSNVPVKVVNIYN